MDKSPLISVIVPVFEAESYLRQCVQSVLAQTYSNWQLILVDDGSMDNSAKICDEYAARDSRISVLHIPNCGMSAARNKALEFVEGDYIAFLDADDMLAPCFLSFTLNVAIENNLDVVAVDLTRKERGLSGAPSNKKMETYTGKEFVEKILYQRFRFCTNAVWGKLYKAEVLEDVRFQEGIIYEDLEIFPRLLEEIVKVGYVPERLYFYRQHPKSAIHTFNRRRLDVLDVTAKMVSDYSPEGIKPDYCLHKAASDRQLSANFNIMLLLIEHEPDNSATINSCWEVIKRNRLASLVNPNVRFKNKFAVLMSYFGGKLLFISGLKVKSFSKSIFGVDQAEQLL